MPPTTTGNDSDSVLLCLTVNACSVIVIRWRRSARAPRQDRADGVVPHRAHGGASKAGEPPERALLIEDNRGDADIGDRAEAADQRERDEPAHEAPAGEAAVAVGQDVVEREIAHH